MARKSSVSIRALAALPLVTAGMLGITLHPASHAQAAPRISAPIDGSPLVSLPGTVHPWARAAFDRGVAPASLSGRMLMVLQRSPQQQEDLKTLLAAQQDPKSPSYHKWLSPADFGKRFGVADADVQTVTGYLSSQGLSVGRVYGNHTAIEVTATAEQMRSTFQTEIHAYAVGGKTYYANNSAPRIPAALRGVVSGFAAMNDFHVAGGSGAGTAAQLDTATHTLQPLYTGTVNGGTVYGVTPGDLSLIYSVPTTNGVGAGGQGINVGVVGNSNINVDYVNRYRSVFGLSANAPVVVVDGNDPGITDDAYIGYKQIELIGAVAPNATVYYYTSADDYLDAGLDFAMIRAVEDNQVQVLVNGYQGCEQALGPEMALVNGLWEQAAAQGITVVAASGNTGAASCEIPGSSSPATSGYAVNGFATSPYATAVGGTDFNYGGKPLTTYWKAATAGTYTSAKGYIPEQVWNDSVPTNVTGAGASVLLAGGGGVSTAGLDGDSLAQPIPYYQSSNAAANTIGGGKSRVVPDISFFAASGANDTVGYNSTAYIFCMKSTDCITGNGAVQFTYSGGTEASSAVFAGAMALVVQHVNGSGAQFGVGNANPTLYSMVANNGITNHDITIGNNKLKCTGAINCANGTMTGYAAGAGYDAATGLGSLDIGSLVASYAASNVTPSKVSISVIDPATGKPPVCGATPNCTTHSTPLKFVVSAASQSGAGAAASGDVAIYTSSPLAADQAVEVLTLANGTATDPSYNLLPGGTYKIYARYAGDKTYSASVTATPYPITVRQEACTMVVHASNVQYAPTFTPIQYGSPVQITVEPYSSASPNNVAIPSGSINVMDGGSLITTLPVNSEGSATFRSNLLGFGTHSIVLAYAGDASMSTCQSPAFGVNVQKAPTSTVLYAPSNNTAQGAVAVGITAIVSPLNAPSNGTSPAGTVTFSTKVPKTVTLVPGFDPNGNAIATANLVVGVNDVPASGAISATYNPPAQANYLTSTSNAVAFSSTNTLLNFPTTTTFTITDSTGNTYVPPTNGTMLSFPAQDSLTLNLHVDAFLPTLSTFVVSVNGVQIGGALAIDGNGNANITLPQQNGYLALPSGQVQISVVYQGWQFLIFGQTNPSSAIATVLINDDRTGADFSLQSDTTVNQQSPLAGAVKQATYNLRLTSIYNFQSAFSATPIHLSCSVVGYTSFSGVRSTPSGLQCGFNSALTATNPSLTFAANSTATGFITQALYVGAGGGSSISSNTTPSQPTSHWWLTTGGATLACVLLLGLPARRRHWQSLLGVIAMVVFSFGISGCGATAANKADQQYYTDNGSGNGSGGSSSSGSGTGTPQAGGTAVPAGTYTVMVTATTYTNTTLTHTLPVQVIVGIQ